MNHEGYKDPTAEKAIKNADRMPRQMQEATRHLKAIASLLGFDIMELKDKRTGRRYRV